MGRSRTFFIYLLAFVGVAATHVLSLHADQGKKVKVGVILPLAGPFARYGEKIRESISHFESDQIQFVYEDEGCDPKVAVTAYTKLSDFDHIKLFLGPWCGSPQSAIASRLKPHMQLALLGSSAPQVVFEMSKGQMLSTQHSIEAESTFLAKEAARLGAKKVVIIFRENQFSRAHESAFRATFPGKILETLAYNSDDISELKAIALRVKVLQPDALYIPDAFPLMAGLLKELGAIGLGNLKIFSVYSAQSEDVLKVVGKAGEGIVYSYPAIDEKDALDVFPMLAAQCLSAAVKECGDNIDCVRESLVRQNNFDEHGVLKGALTLKTIRNGKFVKFEG